MSAAGQGLRAIVVGNGEPPSQGLLEGLLAAGGLLLCADGGANTARRYGLVPDAVVGDLDSVAADVAAWLPPGRAVRVDADDTGTDLGKVLRHAVALGVDRAVLTGVTGRRTDHTLWNLGLLKSFRDRLQLSVEDDYCQIRLIPGRVSFAADLGQRVSLSPLSGAAHGVWTSGLRWQLAGDSLIPGVRDGISNEVVDSPATVQVGAGDLLLVVQRDRAWRPVAYLDGSGNGSGAAP